MTRWDAPSIPEYDLDTDELIYRDAAASEVRREKLGETEMETNKGCRGGD